MIKIVGDDQDKLKKITCSNCAAMLEYSPSDTKEYRGKDYSGGSDGQVWIDCPRCGKKVIIKSW